MALQTSLHHLQLDGWCVLKNIIPPAKVDAIHHTTAATVARHRNPDAPAHIGHLPGYINYDLSLAPYLASNPILELVSAALGPNCKISFTTGTINYPGNGRGNWHADWPFNQSNAGHIPTPYPDALMHLTTIWMLSPFTVDNGATLVVPGSHRSTNNPTGNLDLEMHAPYPTETHTTGPAGSVLVMDSRLWHASAPNTTIAPRVAVVVRYAPWWLDTRILNPGSDTRAQLVDEPGLKENSVPLMPATVYKKLPIMTQKLFRHCVA